LNPKPETVHGTGGTSDRVKRFIEEAGYSNVKFYEVGEIVEG
jgi:hypothetical protein